MRMITMVALLGLAIGTLAGCAGFSFEARGGSANSNTVTPSSDPDERSAKKTQRGPIGIPPGHYPPPGQCRVWHPGTPPGHQPRPGTCSVVERNVGPGDWLLYRPTDEKKVIRVSVYDERRPGVRIAVRVYDSQTGHYLRDM